MRVFVGGASGAIGVPIVKTLVAQGHDVAGSTRSADRAKTLESLGAKVALIDAFDPQAVETRLRAAEPEVVIDALTALPKDGPRKAADLDPTNRVRREATRNLLNAAIAVGARRYVAESFFLVYGTGNLGPIRLTEDQPAPLRRPNPYVAEVIDAALAKERMVLEASKQGAIEGVVTRFAGFYGPGAGTESMLDLLRKRSLPVPRTSGLTPWIYIDDAAVGMVAAATKGRPGEIYNIAEDEPLGIKEFLRTLAEVGGAPTPITLPGFVFQFVAPYLKVLLIDSTIRLSNEKAKRELDWFPRFKSPREGLAALAKSLVGSERVQSAA
jgi:nucleoside-diphosphate-sugar epimerase